MAEKHILQLVGAIKLSYSIVSVVFLYKSLENLTWNETHCGLFARPLGKQDVQEWAKAHNISTRNLSALDRLAYIGRRYMNRHCMTINNKNADIERSDILELAKRYNIKGADAIIEKVISVLCNYEQYAETAGVSPYWTHKIKEEIGYRIDNMTDISHHRGLGR